MLGALVVLATAGCTGGDSADSGDGAARDRPAASRQEVAAALIADVVVPGYERARTTATDLHASTQQLCAAANGAANGAVDDAAIAATRSALVEAWTAWERTRAFDVGPAMDRRSTAIVDYTPDPEAIDEVLATSPPADAATVRNRTASPRRGFGAVDHLLVAEPTGVRRGEVRATSPPSPRSSPTRPPVVATAWADGAESEMGATEIIDAVVNIGLSRLEAQSKLLVDPGSADAVAVFRLVGLTDGTAAVADALSPLMSGRLETRCDRRSPPSRARWRERSPTTLRPPTPPPWWARSTTCAPPSAPRWSASSTSRSASVTTTAIPDARRAPTPAPEAALAAPAAGRSRRRRWWRSASGSGCAVRSPRPGSCGTAGWTRSWSSPATTSPIPA